MLPTIRSELLYSGLGEETFGLTFIAELMQTDCTALDFLKHAQADGEKTAVPPRS